MISTIVKDAYFINGEKLNYKLRKFLKHKKTPNSHWEFLFFIKKYNFTKEYYRVFLLVLTPVCFLTCCTLLLISYEYLLVR